MRITENRILALVLCVVCALISIFGIGGMKLKGKYNDVTEYFVEGEDERHNMEAYLDRCSEYADDLANAAKKYLIYDEEIDAVLEFSDELNADKGPSGDRYYNFHALTNAVEELYTQLEIAGSYEEPDVMLAYGDYQSACDLIKRDGYFEMAASYNDMVSGFPAGMIASMWGVGWADDFGR